MENNNNEVTNMENKNNVEMPEKQKKKKVSEMTEDEKKLYREKCKITAKEYNARYYKANRDKMLTYMTRIIECGVCHT